MGEAEIINHADKRVLHDRAVPLDKRLDYILEKYGRLPGDQERIRWLWEKTLKLEENIFDDLTFGPEALNRLLNAKDLSKDFDDYQKTCSLT